MPSLFLFLSVPAVGAELALGQAYRLYHVIKTVVHKRGEILLLAHLVDHFLVVLAFGIGVIREHLVGNIVAFALSYSAASYQVKLRLGARKVQIFAAEHDRRAGGSDVNLGRAAVIQKFCGLSELCSAHDRVVDQQQALVVDELLDRNKLHFGDHVALRLSGRHERARPCRSVFDERPRKRYARLVGVAYGVRRARIGNARNHIGLHAVALRQLMAAVVAHLLNVDTLVC